MESIDLPSWTELLPMLGEKPPRHNRARCPIHNGDSPTSVSLDIKRGLFYCHVCGAGGDRIGFIERTLRTDFKGALRFLGIERGRLPAPDPVQLKHRQKLAEIEAWARSEGRKIRDEIYMRHLALRCGLALLAGDDEDPIGWNFLEFAYTGLDASEHKADQIDIGTPAEIAQNYREMCAP